MTTTYTPQAKAATSYAKQGMPNTSTGEVFFGWMFLFTYPVFSGSNFSKVPKAASSFTSVAKP